MVNDLYYFYESDFSKRNLVDFGNSLPTHIQAKFVDSMEGVSVLDRDLTNKAVVQEFYTANAKPRVHTRGCSKPRIFVVRQRDEI